MSTIKTFAWRPQNLDAKVASARIRCLNTIRQLRVDRFPIELYRQNRESRYHAVIFSKAYKRKDIAVAERLKEKGIKIVFDLCDNHFLLGPERLSMLKTMYALSNHWVVSSHSMVNVVRQYVGKEKPITVIGDAVEEDLSGGMLDISGWFKAQCDLIKLKCFLAAQTRRGATSLVWFGKHKASYYDSGLSHINKVRPLLERMDRSSHRMSLTVISDSREAFDTVFREWQIPSFYLNWNAHNFLSAMNKHRIAIIPIDVNEFTAVKTNNRIAFSLHCGLGVVADGIDSYRDFEDCAFLDNWELGLRCYLDNPRTIDEHVDRARLVIKNNFSLPVISAQWRRLLENL